MSFVKSVALVALLATELFTLALRQKKNCLERSLEDSVVSLMKSYIVKSEHTVEEVFDCRIDPAKLKKEYEGTLE